VHQHKAKAVFGGDGVQRLAQGGVLVGAVILDQESAHFAVVQALGADGMHWLARRRAHVVPAQLDHVAGD